MIEIPLKTDRFTIRRFLPEDETAFLRFMLDADSTRYLSIAPEQKTREGAAALFAYILENYDTSDVIHAYAIIDTASGDYLGSCGYALYEQGAVECYFCVNPEHRGMHIAIEATSAMVKALARKVEVRAYCHPDNVAAQTIAKQCGMEHVSSSRKNSDDKNYDLYVYPADD